MEVVSMMQPRMHGYCALEREQHFAPYHSVQPQHPQMARPQSMPSHSRPAPSDRTHRNTMASSMASQPPTSGKADDKPSLPSISNLLVIADGERNPQSNAQSDFTYDHIQPSGPDTTSSQRTTMPPSSPPSIRSDSVVGPNYSPSTISVSSSSGLTYYSAPSLNDADIHRQRAASDQSRKQYSTPSHFNTSPIANALCGSPPSMGSYYSPPNIYPPSGLYQQRPLASNFPPTTYPTSTTMPPPGVTPSMNPWEHHHYISASSQASFPQTQDRYICPSCQKAFSRPSSLKIHSHSHTGEKPFQCPHRGCSKKFSVRSNMKRHERGCHETTA